MSETVGHLKSLWSRYPRGWIVVVAGLLVAASVSLWAFRGRSAADYYAAKVERGDVIQIVSATGTINAVTTVQVGSQVSGNIKKLSADFNSHVKKGQLIAEIDPALFQALLLQAEADLANADASAIGLQAQIETQRAEILSSMAGVDKAQAQLNDAQLQYKRAKDLADQGIFPVSQSDTALSASDSALASLHAAQAVLGQSKAKLNASIAALDQAKAQVKQRKAAVDMARLNLEHCNIYAPIDGTVIARNVEAGQTVAASLQAPTLFVIAQDLTKMLVYAKTDEADVGRIQVGATASFRVDSFPREIFSGTVTQIRMNATMIQNVVTYDTIVAFDNVNQRLFPGMTAYVSIPVASDTNVVKIPNGALRFTPSLTPQEVNALYAKYNTANSGGGKGGSGAASSGPGGGGAARGGGGRPGGKAGGSSGAGAAAGAGSNSRDDSAVVWKLHADKSLEPVRVKLGVTDFTFTAMKEGTLKPGDDLVIGEASKGSKPAQTSPVSPGGPRKF
ncbi:MAG TPA: efflux RND transporter periplasmic adaptor subunit [Candidatus Acidoferrales bacterium]|nr:efflux RND transporter periplasmic adaptor subunit [Candidatus Acidoferrales bacterium]